MDFVSISEEVISDDSSENENVIDGEETKKEDTIAIERLDVDFEKLLKVNSSVKAWVKVNNTNINYAVVQGKNNSYYLKHNIYGEYNGAGWIFADSNDNFEEFNKNLIIFGHNRRNGTMFSNLNLLLGDDWNFEKENSFFYFTTLDKNYICKIFSVYQQKAKSLKLPYDFNNDEEFMKYVKEVKEKSIHDFKVDVNKDDIMITLCTCDNTTNNRILVQAILEEI